MAGDRLVTCHRDLHPGNVLGEACGELAVLDWDDAGPACPDRELAGLLMFWHGRDDGTADDGAVRRTLPRTPSSCRHHDGCRADDVISGQ